MSAIARLPSIFREQPEPQMTASEPASRHWWQRKSIRTWFVVALVFALLVALQFVGVQGSASQYDPNSTYPGGTKGFVELLQRTGADVVRDSRPQGDVAVLMYDTLNKTETDYVQKWVEDGGTLIVSDPYSSLQLGTFSNSVVSVPLTLEPHCTGNYLRGVRGISPSRKGKELFFKNDLNADNQCFRAGKNSYFFQERYVGKGRVFALGGSDIFTNDRLNKADNAVFLMNLIQPSAQSSVTLLQTTATSADTTSSDVNTSLYSLFSTRFKDGLWLLFVGVALYAMWRARRLGRPVEEEPLVRIPASQLVSATGDLLELADQPQAAAAMLRDDLRRSLADRFGLRVDADTAVFVELVSQRTGIDAQRIRVALNDAAVTGPESLVVYAQQVERLQMEVRHVR